MPTLDNTLKELIKESVREVILEELKNGKLPQPMVKSVREEKVESSEIKKRDPLSIVRPKELCEMLSISVATLYRWISEDKFPKKVKLGPSAVGWRYSDIEEWLNE